MRHEDKDHIVIPRKRGNPNWCLRGNRSFSPAQRFILFGHKSAATNLTPQIDEYIDPALGIAVRVFAPGHALGATKDSVLRDLS